jgi:hypothetical protein
MIGLFFPNSEKTMHLTDEQIWQLAGGWLRDEKLADHLSNCTCCYATMLCMMG